MDKLQTFDYHDHYQHHGHGHGHDSHDEQSMGIEQLIQRTHIPTF